MKRLLLPIVLIYVVLLVSCNRMEELKMRRIIKNEYGKVLDLSWSGYQVLADTVLNNFEIRKPITIVTHIYEDLCWECFSNYLKVAERYVNLFHSDSIQFVCIAYPRPVKELQSALDLAHTDPTKVMVVYDSDDVYLSSNNITKLKSGMNAFLIDRNHRIVLMGDPVRYDPMHDLYKKTIESLLENIETNL